MSSPFKTIHVFVSGTVHGVYFRKSTQAKANELGLHGWVRNLTDGRVETVVVGPEKHLLLMIDFLGKGPIRARVEQVDLSWIDNDENDQPIKFEILPTASV